MKKHLIVSVSAIALFATPVFADAPDPGPRYTPVPHNMPDIPVDPNPDPNIPSLEHGLDPYFSGEEGAVDLSNGGPGRQTSNVSQTGDWNSAYVNQVYGQEGISSIGQNGYQNRASVIQSEADVEANGHPGSSSPDFNTPANVSTVTQGTSDASSNYNSADVRQVASPDGAQAAPNTSGVVQASSGSLDGDRYFSHDVDDGYGGTATKEYLLQANVYQDGEGNTSGVDQSGSGNLTDVKQWGNDQNSTVWQGGVDNALHVGQQNGLEGTGGNVSDVAQGGEKNVAGVWQEGTNNGAWVGQYGKYNSLDSQQTGSDNSATLSQYGYNNETGGRLGIENIQFGDGNVTSVYQAAVASSTSNIQKGDLNTSSFEQTGWNNNTTSTQFGDGNNTDVSQGGYNNTIESDQDGWNNQADLSQWGVNNDSDVTGIDNYQWGTGNNVVVSQESRRSHVNTYQNGNYNVGDVTQTGKNNAVDNIQRGNGNNFTATQGTAGELGNNSITNDQTGDDNATTLAQTGEWNEINVWQAGDRNSITATQSGWANEIEAAQVGFDNAITVTNQSGEYNDILLTQHGNENAILVNNQSGSNNLIAALQKTDLNVATFSQDGWDNTATVKQGLTGSVANVSYVGQWGGGNVATVLQ